MATDWKDRHIVILGAARQGLALARWLAEHGAIVTLSDKRQEPELAAARSSLQGHSIQWAPGGHPLDLLNGADMLCLSGGVPTDLPIVAEAFKRGIQRLERHSDIHGSGALQDRGHHGVGRKDDDHLPGRPHGAAGAPGKRREGQGRMGLEYLSAATLAIRSSRM